MKRPLPISGMMAGMILLAIGYFVPVFASDKPTNPDEPHQVILETLSGEQATGQLLNAIIQIKYQYGTQGVEHQFIKRISFRTPDNPSSEDVIELVDKNRIRGTIQTDSIQIKTSSGDRGFKPTELRELKNAQAKKDSGFLAIVLALFTLSAMEIVLGIDNIIFLAILVGKLPPEQQPKARQIGLAAALGTRLLLLLFLTVLLGLTKPLFTLPEWGILEDLEAREVSLRDLILMVGGMFLIGKSTMEIHHKLEGEDHTENGSGRSTSSFTKVIIQIAIIDIVFSLDSVITAVGMVDEVWIMMVAMIIAMGVMLIFAGKISDFVAKHPTIKILALSFLILIGVMLVAESLGQHIDKGYIYFAMAFSVIVELINLRVSKPSPVVLHERHYPKPTT